jgi:uncharacterized protein YutE (UPF0331/DUF86 family)
MKDYSKILKEISTIIESEKKSIEFTSATIVNLIDTSIIAYDEIKSIDSNSTFDKINSILISLEVFAQSVVDICNQFIASNISNQDFVHVLSKLKELHNSMLASLIILRTDASDLFQNNLD